MKRTPSLVRAEHPTMETYERVLTNGVMVERGGDEHRRLLWGSLSIGGLDLLRGGADLSQSEESSDRGPEDSWED